MRRQVPGEGLAPDHRQRRLRQPAGEVLRRRARERRGERDVLRQHGAQAERGHRLPQLQIQEIP